MFTIVEGGRNSKPNPSLGNGNLPKANPKKEKIIEPDFNLETVEGKVKLSKSVVLKPFETVLVSGISGLRQHRKRVNVMIERVEGSS